MSESQWSSVGQRPSASSTTPLPGLGSQGTDPSHLQQQQQTTTRLPRVSVSGAPVVGTFLSSAVPVSATAFSRTSLAPLIPYPASAGVECQPPPSVLNTYPPATPTTGEAEDEKVSPSPTQPFPASADAALGTTESMELAVVPFVGNSCDPGSARSNHQHRHRRSDNEIMKNDGRTGPYGELAPTTVSTERVCPHCLRPYEFYDEDPYGDLYDPVGAFYRPGDAPVKQLPALPPSGTPQEQQSQQQHSRYFMGASAPSSTSAKELASGAGKEGCSPPRVTDTRSPSPANHKRIADLNGSGGGYSGPAFPPPAVAFTAHYFRALPPPAVIATAMATGASPLAIEDHHSSFFSLDDEEEGQGQPMYAAVVAGGQQQQQQQYARTLNGYNGALVAAQPAAPVRYVRGSPSMGKAPASPLKLMQSEEEEDASEQVLLPDDKERAPLLRELIDNEEEQNEPGGSPSSPVDSPNAPGPAPNNGYYKHYFRELRQLGRGTYGGVYLCRHLMCGVNLGDFALKKIPVGDKAGYLQSVLREVRILEEVRRHPNVVEYKHSWVEDAQLADFGPPVRCLFILMEYASAGSLDAYLEKYGTHLSTLAVWYFFLSAVAGTAHLHQKHILHRDLKPQNLLLAESKGRPPRVLVSDFGTAAILGDISYERSGGTGTLEYMAPELFEMATSLRGVDEHYVNHHTVASDVWSLGMILYYLAFDATLPERRADGSVVLDTPRQKSYGRPLEMMHLMEAMLQLDPTKRPRCSDILGSSLVQSILRTFNQDDLTQWDLLVQQRERTRKGAAVMKKKHSSPQMSLSPRLVHDGAAVAILSANAGAISAAPSGSGDVDRRRSSGAHVAPHNSSSGNSNRHHITVTSTSAPSLQLRRNRQTASNDSALSDSEALYNSRVVELQSTTALMNLAATQPTSGPTVGDEQHPQQQQPSHGRGRAARRLSPTMERHGAKIEQLCSVLTHHPRSPHSGFVSSPAGTPPSHTVDEGVQTDPVKIVYE